MNINVQLIAFFVGILSTASLASEEMKPLREIPKLESFEFLGCAGDWTDKNTSDSVRRLTFKDKVTYLIRHPGTCGLEGRNPTATFTSGKLDLSYELYSPNGDIVMCECEYWAKFTFGPSAMLLSTVTFEGRTPTLLGSWPNGL
jgi:hypothetical protein